MTSNDQFFQQQKPAAVLKHALLTEYVRVFASMVGSRHSGPVWLIDGYAGPGYYEADAESPRVPGSPVIALRLARESTSLRCIFVENSPVHAACLRRLVEAEGASNVAHVYEADVGEAISDAWRLVGANPVVTFLDPFGVALERRLVSDVLLARRSKSPSEVLINLNVESVWRIGGNLEVRHGEVVPRPGQEPGVAKVDAFFGSKDWRDLFYEVRSEGGSAARAAEHVLAQYRDELCRQTGYHALSVPIRRRPNHQTLFLLTLFFRHPAAGFKFADAASRANRKWREAYRKYDLSEEDEGGTQESLFDVAQMSDSEAKRIEKRLDAEWDQQIAANIEAVLHDRPSLPVAQVENVFGTALGLAGVSHLQRAWDDLAQRGVVRARCGSATWKSVVQAESARGGSGI